MLRAKVCLQRLFECAFCTALISEIVWKLMMIELINFCQHMYQHDHCKSLYHLQYSYKAEYECGII